MKSIVISFIAFFLFSCVTPKELTLQDSEKVYEQKTSLNKNELKIKFLSYVNEGFNNAKAVIQSNEDGFLSGNYDAFLKNYDLLAMYKVYARITFMIKYSDNNYKVKLVLKSVYMVKDGVETTLDQSYWGNYSPEIQDQFNQFDIALSKYIEKKDTF